MKEPRPGKAAGAKVLRVNAGERDRRLDNARYWYRQARRPPATGVLATEWATIAATLLASKRASKRVMRVVCARVMGSYSENRKMVLASDRPSPMRRNGRILCGAKTRAGGRCLVRAEPGRARCRFHGGKSTGPRTPAGRARIAEAQRQRWRVYRESVRPVSHEDKAGSER